MKTTKNITQDRLTSLYQYNPETGVFTRYGREVGFLNWKGYILIQIDDKRYRAHRLAWFYTHGEWPNSQIDHIDHDRTNNAITNLRLATPTDNARNQSLHLLSTSGTTGVYWDTGHARWRACITLNYKTKHLGSYKNKEDAIAARQAANVAYGFHENHGQAA
jgi:hypothetical protein